MEDFGVDLAQTHTHTQNNNNNNNTRQNVESFTWGKHLLELSAFPVDL